MRGFIISCLALGLFLLGPAPGFPSSDHELLDVEYGSMSNEELAEYYDDLGEAIEDCEDYTGKQIVGKGTKAGKSYGSDVGVSFGTMPGTKSCDSRSLRERQAEVRALMLERGMEL